MLTRELDNFFNWMMAFVLINNLVTFIAIRMIIRLKQEVEDLAQAERMIRKVEEVARGERS